MDKNSILERFGQFIDVVYGGRRAVAAQKLGVSLNTINTYFTKLSVPGGDFLRILSENGCDLNWLLTGMGSMFNNTPAGKGLKRVHATVHEEMRDEEYETLLVELAEMQRQYAENLSEIVLRQTRKNTTLLPLNGQEKPRTLSA